MGNTEKADELFQKGNELMEKEDYDGAIASFSKAIECDEFCLMAYLRRATLYLCIQENYDGAIADFSKALSFCKNLDSNDAAQLEISILPDRARCYNAKNQFDKAIADCNAVIKLDSSNNEAYDQRGYAYYKQGDMDNAVADWKIAAKNGNQNAIDMLEELGVS